MEDFIEKFENETIRLLLCFDKKTERLFEEEELVNLNVLDLRKIFNVTASFYKSVDEPYDEAYDPYMYNGYDVDEEKAKALQPYIKHKINLDKYDYQIAAYQRPESKG